MELFRINMLNAVCGGADILKVIKFVTMLLDIVLFLVPILLILMVSVDFVKSVIAGRVDDMTKNGKMVLKRLICCVALFLVEPIVSFTIELVADFSGRDINFASCIYIALNDDLSLYETSYVDEDYDSIKSVNLGSFSYDISDVKTSSGGAKEFLESLDKMSKKVQNDAKGGNKWLYQNSNTKNTFDKADQTSKNTNCALYVNWALIDIGVMESGERFYKCYDSCGNTNKINYRKTNKDELSKKLEFIDGGNKSASSLIKNGTLQAGDIVLWYNHQHTNVYAGENKWYDAGRQGGIVGSGSSDNFRFTTLGPVELSGWINQNVWMILRVK